MMYKLKRALCLFGMVLLSAYPFAGISLIQYRLWQNGMRGTWQDFVFYILSLFCLLLFADGLRKFGKYNYWLSVAASLVGLALGMGLLYLLLPMVG